MICLAAMASAGLRLFHSFSDSDRSRDLDALRAGPAGVPPGLISIIGSLLGVDGCGTSRCKLLSRRGADWYLRTTAWTLCSATSLDGRLGGDVRDNLFRGVPGGVRRR